MPRWHLKIHHTPTGARCVASQAPLAVHQLFTPADPPRSPTTICTECQTEVELIRLDLPD